MITLTSDNFTVEYQSNIMFNWAYNPVTVRFLPEGSDNLEYIDLTVSRVDGGGGITFRRYFTKSGVISFDLSRGLQALRQEEVKLTVTDEPGNVLTSFIYCINGYKGAIEQFGAEIRQIRIWDGIETILPFYFKENINVVARNKTGREVLLGQFNSNTKTGYGFAQVALNNSSDINFVFARGLYFDGANWSASKEWRYNIVKGCKPTGESIYLRWTDKQGIRWFWLFKVNEKTTATDNYLEYGRMPSVGDGLINEFSGESQKMITMRAKIGTYQITDDEYKVVSTLYNSALVDAYDTTSKRWYRIKVQNGERNEPKGNYRAVEIDIEFPSEKTQLP